MTCTAHNNKMSSNHEPLIVWFLRELAKAVKQTTFRSWNEKHKFSCPWLTHTRMTYLHPVFDLLGDISICFINQDFLAAEKNLPCEKHEPFMQLIIKTITRIKEGALSKTISQFERAPIYHCYFRNYVEVISPQPNSLVSR